MEKIKNYLKNFVESKKFNTFVYGFIIAVFALLIFQAGVFVGFHKASFSYRWGDNYQKYFEMRGRGDEKMDGFKKIFGDRNPRKNEKDFFGNMPMQLMPEFMGAHGTTGKIIDIKLPSIVVSDSNNIEKAVFVSSSTIIRQFRDNLTPENLKVGDRIVVIGSPNDNFEIEARMIRLVPENIDYKIATSTNQ